jgi:hypothetical protein
VYGLAQKFPQITFLVKPHHAGKWLTGRYKGEIASFTNLVIADPSLSPWEKYTAPSLMNSMVAVITSPSTVALDAARAAIPVALVRFDLELKNYEPLPMIGNSLDWSDFVSECLSDSSNAVRLANSFAQASVMPGSASERILDTLLGENFQSAVDDAK